MNRRQNDARVQRTLLRWVVARLDGYVVRYKGSTVDQSGNPSIVSGVFHELNVGLVPRDSHLPGLSLFEIYWKERK